MDTAKLQTWKAEHGFSISMSLDDAESIAHQGQCDDDVAALGKRPDIAAQLDAIPDDKLVAELREYGAWNKHELADREANLMRILWIVGCDIKEASRLVD